MTETGELSTPQGLEATDSMIRCPVFTFTFESEIQDRLRVEHASPFYMAQKFPNNGLITPEEKRKTILTS